MFSRASEARHSTLHQTNNNGADLDDEPGEDEIREYADTIGIDVDNEPELMWVARAGITAPMPSDEWRPVETSTGDLYFFNFKTKESSWEHPSDEKYRKMVIEERKRLQMRQKPSQQSTPATNANKQPPPKPIQEVPVPPQSLNAVRAPVGRLTPIGTTPAANPSSSKPNRLAPLGESTPPVTNTAATAPTAAARPSTSRGQRPSAPPTPQQQNPIKETPAKPQVPKNPPQTKEPPVTFTLGGGSRFLKGNAPPVSEDVKKDTSKVDSAEVITFTPHGERLNLIADIASLDEDESDETESSTTESPLNLKETMKKPLATLTSVEQKPANTIPPKSVLVNKADKSEKSSKSTSSSVSEKRVSFEMDLKEEEDKLRMEYEDRLNKLKQDLEQAHKRQEAELSATKRRLEDTHAKRLEAAKKDSEQKLTKDLSALEANERAQLDQLEKDISNRRQILKDRFDRELNDDKADYESKLAKARREWKEKMSAEEAKLAAEFREVTQMERETAKQRKATITTTAAIQHTERATSPVLTATVDRAIVTDVRGPPPAAPPPPKPKPVVKPSTLEASTQMSIDASQVEGVASKLEVKLNELTQATMELQTKMAVLNTRAVQIAVEPPNLTNAPPKINKTGDDSLDDLASLATNGTSIAERVPDNTADIVRRAKELLESPAEKKLTRQSDLLIDSGFDRSIMSDRAPPPSMAVVVQSSLRQLQQDLNALSTHLTGNHHHNESRNRTLLDVDSFINEKWHAFSSESIHHPQLLLSHLPNGLSKTATETTDIDDKLADLKAWLSAFESQVTQAKF